ncbi:MAG: hypothetical protein ACXVZV_05625 [Terriglobales bacterium]
MLRFTFLTATLASLLVIGASAQVAINGGYATTAPPPANVLSTATELGIPSVPAINTPFAHVGPEGPPQPATDETQTSAPSQPAVVQIQNPAPVSVQINPAVSQPAQPINLGVAIISENPFVTGPSNPSGKSLGEIARETKQKEQNTNAKRFTNADIEKMSGSQTSGGISGATTANTNGNNEWPANNGVITPPPANNQNQGAIAAPSTPAPNNQANSPFTPRTQNENTPANATPMPAENAPQANEKPSPNRPYEMAQNNPASGGMPQSSETGNAAANPSNEPATAQNARLPKTASRLPLLGVLGFVSVSMGLFVRYQRAKAVK